MATKTIVTVLDDMDGTEGAETIPFALNGTQYEIDLNAKNSEKLKKALTPFIESARRVSRTTGGTGRRVNARTARANTQAIREWATANGIEIGAKGRIPGAIMEQYEAAQSAPAPTASRPARRKAAAKS